MFGINVSGLKEDFAKFNVAISQIPKDQLSKIPEIVAIVAFIQAISKDV